MRCDAHCIREGWSIKKSSELAVEVLVDRGDVRLRKYRRKLVHGHLSE